MSNWLEDREAKQFYGCISNMRRLEPVATWFDCDSTHMVYPGPALILQQGLNILLNFNRGWTARECLGHKESVEGSQSAHRGTVAGIRTRNRAALSVSRMHVRQ